MAKETPSTKIPKHVQVTFGRAVTDEDVRRLQQTSDVIEAKIMPDEVVDEDHVHVHPN